MVILFKKKEEDTMNKRGWIEVVCGPMFAGKSEELIRRVRRLGFAKKKFIVFKPTIDNRYSENEVVSHDKRSLKSIKLKLNLLPFHADQWMHETSLTFSLPQPWM